MTETITLNETTTGTITISGDNGGSQTGIQFVPVEFSFDTPSIVEGIECATLAEGEVLLTWGTSVATPFNGTTPKVRTYCDPDDPTGSEIDHRDADAGPDEQKGSSNGYLITGGVLNDCGTIARGGPMTIYARLDDDADGDPESSEGALTILLFIGRV